MLTNSLRFNWSGSNPYREMGKSLFLTLVQKIYRMGLIFEQPGGFQEDMEVISVLRNKRTPRAACPTWLPTISRQPAAHPFKAKARLLGISGQPEGSAFPFPWPAGGAPLEALRPPAPRRLLAAGRGSAPWGGLGRAEARGGGRGGLGGSGP